MKKIALSIVVMFVTTFWFVTSASAVSSVDWTYEGTSTAEITYYERTDSTTELLLGGYEDTLVASVTIQNKYESDFLAEVLGGGFDPSAYAKDEDMGDTYTSPYPWVETGVVGPEGYFAYDFLANEPFLYDGPAYFLVKLGGGGDDVLATHFIYTNITSTQYAVVNLADFGDVDEYRISHIGAPVPEPSTLLLLGAGIVGLVAYRRKKN